MPEEKSYFIPIKKKASELITFSEEAKYLLKGTTKMV